MCQNLQGDTPPAGSWFIHHSTYRYIYHIPWLLLELFAPTLTNEWWYPLSTLVNQVISQLSYLGVHKGTSPCMHSGNLTSNTCIFCVVNHRTKWAIVHCYLTLPMGTIFWWMNIHLPVMSEYNGDMGFDIGSKNHIIVCPTSNYWGTQFWPIASHTQVFIAIE